MEPERIKTYLYQLVCRDKSVQDKYIGYTTQYDDMIARWYDASVKQPPYMDFINDNGGIDQWDIEIIKIYNSREKAEIEKSLRLLSDPDYTLNRNGRKLSKKRFFRHHMCQ